MRAFFWLAFALLPAVASAQKIDVIDGSAEPAEAASPEDQNQRPFQLPTQSSEVIEALDDFSRYRDRNEWERAFKALEKIRSADANKLLPAKDGFLLPVAGRVRQALTDLPPAGREAYRLFYDAEAKQRLSAAQGKAEVARLSEVYQNYFITSVGDVAADRLGDCQFERGNMDPAADCWEAVLRHHADSKIPRVQLLTKAAIARGRGGRWRQFDEHRQAIQDRHAGESVVLGGKAVRASEHLTGLNEQLTRTALAESRTTFPDFEFADTMEPLWRFEFYSPEERQTISSMASNWGWNRLPMLAMVPPVAFDDRRCYLNLLGAHVAIDHQTGKLLWRSARMDQAVMELQRNPYGFQMPAGLAVAGDKLWSVSSDVGESQSQPGRELSLWCRNVAGGKTSGKRNDKVAWESSKNSELETWHPQGSPLPHGERLYVTARPDEKEQELHVLCLRSKDGKLLWSTLVGTHHAEENRGAAFRSAQPQMLLVGDKLYLETHVGAVAEIDTVTGKLNWGFTYDAEQSVENNWYSEVGKLTTQGEPLLYGGALYIKGMRSTRLCAIDLATATLLWQRPVEESALLVAIDGQRILCTGQELTCIDLATRKMSWSTPLPVGTGWIRPVVTQTRIYQFTPRGIFEFDKATGDRLRIFRGADLESLGGEIYLLPHALVTVSNLGITAYPRVKTTAL